MESRRAFRQLVLDVQAETAALEACKHEPDSDDELWLVSQLLDSYAEVRLRVAWALGRARTEGAAVALYLAIPQERNARVRGVMGRSLGRIGEKGRRYLVYLLQTGNKPWHLIAAYAMSCGVKLPTPRGYVSPGTALEWWDAAGQSLFKRDCARWPVGPAADEDPSPRDSPSSSPAR